MKTTVLATLLCLIMAATLSAQSVSDKVLFDRATVLVKGLRTGTSWNKTVADLKKEFPDMKELEPFKVSEDAAIQTQEFGALYNFDSEALKKQTRSGVTCTNFPKMKFSFYQNKLYRVEIYYPDHPYVRVNFLSYKMAYSFFNNVDSVELVGQTLRYSNVRASNVSFNPNQAGFECDMAVNADYSYLIYTNIPIETLFYADQYLLHPEIGYTTIKWGSNFKEVSNIYKNMVEESDGDSVWGVKRFVVKYTGENILRRIFSFYQDSLFHINVVYSTKEKIEPGYDVEKKLISMYRQDVKRSIIVYSGRIEYYSPLEEKIMGLVARQKENLRKEQEKKRIDKTDL